MKKFYTLALAAAVSLAASAEGRVKANQLKSFNTVEISSNAQRVTMPTSVNKPMRAVKKSAASVDNFEGQCNWIFDWALNGDEPDPVADISVVNASTGEVEIEIAGWIVKGTFDLEAGTLSLPNNQYIGKDNFGDDNYFYIKGVSSEGEILDGMSDIEASIGNINGQVIEFPTYDIWAIGDPNDEDLGWWLLSYSNVFDCTAYESIGTATIAGDFYASGFGFDIFNDYTVNAYLSEDGSIFKIEDALKPMYAEIGIDSASPTMKFNISDPENVVLDFVFSGLGTQTEGGYYCFSYSFVETPTKGNNITYTTVNGKNVITCQPASLMLFTENQSFYTGNNAVATISFSSD
ncbi:MAG: hypothetical protein K2M68_05255, partial [Muribaculaceae bacterium]|nr:hypothetical protein [Muribaculaceae bacterium]